MKPGSFTASMTSVALHGGLVLVLAVSSYLWIEALSEPSPRRPALLTITLPMAAAAAAPPPSRQGKADVVRTRKSEPVQESFSEVIRPQEALEEAADVPGIDGGVEGGADGGVPGGDPRGTVDGVPGGDLLGVAGGGLSGELSDDSPVYLTGEVRAPERTVFVKPEYPEMARKVRAEGKVILEIVVDRRGEVERVRVLRSHPLFDQAAIEAVRKWRYQPALQNGRPVKVYLTVIVDFGLK